MQFWGSKVALKWLGRYNLEVPGYNNNNNIYIFIPQKNKR